MRLDVKSLINGSVMRSTSFFIQGYIPSLNEYTRVSRGNKYASNGMKQKAEESIIWQVRSQLRGYKAQYPVFLVFRWIEKDRRRDHDNVAFGKKFVQDALVKAGVLAGDGWKHVLGFVDLFHVDKNHSGVQVTILEVGHADKREDTARAD